MFVQAMITIGLLFSLFALSCLAIVLMYYLTHYQVVVLAGAFICEACAGKLRRGHFNLIRWHEFKK